MALCIHDVALCTQGVALCTHGVALCTHCVALCTHGVALKCKKYKCAGALPIDSFDNELLKKIILFTADQRS